MPPLRTENFASTTLAENVSDSDTTFDVASAAVFALAGGDAIVRIDDELLLVKSASSNTLTVERGHEGTTPASHTSGATVGAVITQEMLRRFAAERQAAPENLLINGGFDFYQRQPSSSWSTADMAGDPLNGFDRWRIDRDANELALFQTIGDHVNYTGIAITTDSNQFAISQVVPGHLSATAFPRRRVVLDFWAKSAGGGEELYAGIYHTGGYTRDQLTVYSLGYSLGFSNLVGIWDTTDNTGYMTRINGYGVTGRSGPFVLSSSEWRQFSVWGVTPDLSYPDVRNLMVGIWSESLTAATVLISGVALRIAEGSYYPFAPRHREEELRLCRHFYRRGLVDMRPMPDGVVLESGSFTHRVDHDCPMFRGVSGAQAGTGNGVVFYDALGAAGCQTLHTTGGDVDGVGGGSASPMDETGFTADVYFYSPGPTGYKFGWSHDCEIRASEA